MVNAWGNTKIAAQLTISLSAAKSNESSILSKLELGNRTQVIVRAWEHNSGSGVM